MEDQKLYRTLDAAAMVGITSKEPKNTRYLFMRIMKELGLSPADTKTREGKGGQAEKFWSEEQIAVAKEYYNAHRRNSSPVEDNPNNEVDSVQDSPVTTEPVNDENDDELIDPPARTAADVNDNHDEKLTVQPVSAEIITIDQRAARIRKLTADVQRGIIEIGNELIAAKEEVGHGGWADWLKENFDWTQQTANRFMRVSERFGKLNNVVQFKPSTLQAMLALPEGTEEEFIEEQTEKGTPLEKQSARQVKKNVDEWKQKHAEEIAGEYLNVTGAEKNNQTVEELNHAVTPAVTDSKVTDNTAATVSDTHPTAPANDDDRSILPKYAIITTEQVTAIRELINQTDDWQKIKMIKDSLLELAREISKVIALTEAKIGELSSE